MDFLFLEKYGKCNMFFILIVCILFGFLFIDLILGVRNVNFRVFFFFLRRSVVSRVDRFRILEYFF